MFCSLAFLSNHSLVHMKRNGGKGLDATVAVKKALFSSVLVGLFVSKFAQTKD